MTVSSKKDNFGDFLSASFVAQHSSFYFIFTNTLHYKFSLYSAKKLIQFIKVRYLKGMNFKFWNRCRGKQQYIERLEAVCRSVQLTQRGLVREPPKANGPDEFPTYDTNVRALTFWSSWLLLFLNVINSSREGQGFYFWRMLSSDVANETLSKYSERSAVFIFLRLIFSEVVIMDLDS